MNRLLDDYLSWSSQLERALNYEVIDPEPVDISSLSGIAFAGMGGSGIVGDIISKHLERELDIPVVTVKSYVLPKYVSSKWVVVAISYSGNTLETLITFNEAIKRRARVAVVASGGQLMALADKARLPRVTVEGGHLPRAALPSLLAGAAGLMNRLAGLRISIKRGVEIFRDPDALRKAESAARFMMGGLPVFVVSEDLYPLGLRAKNELNENAKITSKVEILPEWGHNDIVGWEESPRDWLRVVLMRNDLNPILDFAANYLRDLGYDLEVLDVGAPGYLESVLYGSWIIGLASVLLAGLRGVNPEATKSIEKYKEFLRSYVKV